MSVDGWMNKEDYTHNACTHVHTQWNSTQPSKGKQSCQWEQPHGEWPEQTVGETGGRRAE